MNASLDFIALLSDLWGKSIWNLFETIYRAYREYDFWVVFLRIGDRLPQWNCFYFRFFFVLYSTADIANPFKMGTYARHICIRKRLNNGIVLKLANNWNWGLMMENIYTHFPV